MDAKDEVNAVHIYKRLTGEGYLVEYQYGSWSVTEPKGVFMPQKAVGLKTLNEVEVWVQAAGTIRFVLSSYHSKGRKP